jgi:hypothetical protein
VSLTPPVRRTWAPRGVTPVLRDRQRHRPRSRWSGCCATGSAARLLFGFHRGSYDTATPVKVLTGLHAFLCGAPVNLVWDNLKAHKSMPAWPYEPRSEIAGGCSCWSGSRWRVQLVAGDDVGQPGGVAELQPVAACQGGDLVEGRRAGTLPAFHIACSSPRGLVM